ncbi:hypothetical protein D3C72_988610 [compost metagenome]
MGHALRFTDDRHHHISLFRRVDRFVDHLFRRTRINLHRLFVLVQEGDDIVVVSDVSAFGVNHFALFTQRIFDAREYGDGLIGHARSGPTAHHVTLAVGQWANHGEGAGFFQRQRFETVFQQHETFARHFTGLFTMQTAFGIGIRRVGLFRP